MKIVRIVQIVIGALIVALGGLWLLQGSGLVVIEPIACVADCEPLVGPSLPWALAGIVALLIGGFLLWRGLKRG
ncbi:hypothetical protein [Sphingosinicella rhizophila]|uniref:Uncharacterized protein n=1 Tax=Sphingosinicella rhizophila TaxID=3050082 RepID=A0ABU3Q9J2_9SPHN|nr:hypothetical protein [Sphingosinicella sp. GR2756]MDT9600068.1 hypothetical protein [Sphingosinicella sp. GR2756]